MSRVSRIRFTTSGATSDGGYFQETLVGPAVMGGIFGEGIDLVGERLIGVVVVGVGAPQLRFERDLIKEYFDHQTGSDFAYAYQYPGFNQMQQETRCVIRTETGRGIIVLIDDRFTQARCQALFPSHGRGYQVVQNIREIEDKLTRFWSPA